MEFYKEQHFANQSFLNCIDTLSLIIDYAVFLFITYYYMFGQGINPFTVIHGFPTTHIKAVTSDFL